MRTRRSLMLFLVALMILLATALPAVQRTQPARANKETQEDYWPPQNYTHYWAPISVCSTVEEYGKQLTTFLFLPMVKWLGVGLLQVTAKYEFYRWNEVTGWPQSPTYVSQTYISEANWQNPSFSFWFTNVDSTVGCIGACYQSGYVPITLVAGSYFVVLEINRSGIVDRLYVPFAGNQAYGTWYCVDPRSRSPFGPQQANAAQVDSHSPDRGPSTGAAASPPPPRFNYFLPVSVQSLDASLHPTPQPQPTPTQIAPPLPPPSLPPTTNGMGDPGFEGGVNGPWDTYSSSGYEILLHGKDSYLPRSGNLMAWLGGADNETSALTQTVSVPATHPFLSFYALVTSVEDYCSYDHASMLVNGYVAAEFSFCKTNNVETWTRSYVDLRGFSGQTITFSIQMKNDESLLSSLFLDDFTFESGIEPRSANPTPTPTPTVSPTPAPVIRNPGFELGDNGDWTTFSQLGFGTIFTSTDSHTGNWLAWLGGANGETGYIEQSLTVPANQPYLTYWGWINSAETTCGNDRASFIVNGSTVYGFDLCAQNNTSGWAQGWVDLSAFGGTTITVQMRATTNSALISTLYVDDFAFAPAAPAQASPALSPGE